MKYNNNFVIIKEKKRKKLLNHLDDYMKLKVVQNGNKFNCLLVLHT